MKLAVKEKTAVYKNGLNGRTAVREELLLDEKEIREELTKLLIVGVDHLKKIKTPFSDTAPHSFSFRHFAFPSGALP